MQTPNQPAYPQVNSLTAPQAAVPGLPDRMPNPYDPPVSGKLLVNNVVFTAELDGLDVSPAFQVVQLNAKFTFDKSTGNIVISQVTGVGQIDDQKIVNFELGDISGKAVLSLPQQNQSAPIVQQQQGYQQQQHPPQGYTKQPQNCQPPSPPQGYPQHQQQQPPQGYPQQQQQNYQQPPSPPHQQPPQGYPQQVPPGYSQQQQQQPVQQQNYQPLSPPNQPLPPPFPGYQQQYQQGYQQPPMYQQQMPNMMYAPQQPGFVQGYQLPVY